MPPEGFWAFGGNSQWDDAGGSSAGVVPNASMENGILGIYTAPQFPGGEPSEKGWARWAGTSFVTAVASGYYAYMLSVGKSVNESKQLLEEGGRRPNRSLEGEGKHETPLIERPVIPYRQGKIKK